MAKKKALRKATKKAAKKATRNKLEKKQAKKVSLLNRAYKAAVKTIEDLRAKGFNFSKSTMKALSYETFTKKAMKPTQKDIKYYSALSKKTGAYKKATSYEDPCTYEKMTVKQGRLRERRKTIKENKLKKQLFGKSQPTWYDMGLQVIDDIDDSYYLRGKGEAYVNGRNYSTKGDKEDLTDALTEQRDAGADLEKIASKLSEIAGDLEYVQYFEQYEDIMARLKTAIAGSDIEVGYGNLSPVGTPWEDKLEE